MAWGEELQKSQVSYEGDEVSTAEPLVPALVQASLPPSELISSMDILPLMTPLWFGCVDTNLHLFNDSNM